MPDHPPNRILCGNSVRMHNCKNKLRTVLGSPTCKCKQNVSNINMLSNMQILLSLKGCPFFWDKALYYWFNFSVFYNTKEGRWLLLTLWDTSQSFFLQCNWYCPVFCDLICPLSCLMLSCNFILVCVILGLMLVFPTRRGALGGQVTAVTHYYASRPQPIIGTQLYLLNVEWTDKWVNRWQILKIFSGLNKILISAS